jgi:hypothetical protein
MSDVTLAPEALEGIRAAQEDLEQQTARMAAMGDPTAPTAAAMTGAVKALHRLMVDVWLKVHAQLDATDKLIEDGRKPWTRDAMRILIDQLDETLLHRWAAFNRAGIAIGIGVALLFGAVGAAGGWWSRGAVPVVVGMRAGADQCENRADGSRLCWIPVFERPPAITR